MLEKLREKVVANGYCIGCGACAALAPDGIRMELNALGFYQASISPSRTAVGGEDLMNVCPFSGEGPNEDVLARERFGAEAPFENRIGHYLACYAGRVLDEERYEKSSSGGIGKWVLRRLLEKKMVTAVIQVCDTPASAPGDTLFGYRVITNSEDIGQGSKSAYYPIEMSRVLRYVLENPGSYAITGVPCFVKAVRRLCCENAILSERIRYTVGIVCGHLKSKFYAEMIGWQLGVFPDALRSIDFRVKIPGKRANEKGVRGESLDRPGEFTEPKTVQNVFGTNYGQGFFKYKACDYCDDVVAETADISVGDAWLPAYMNKGASLVIVRHAEIRALIGEGVKEGQLHLEEITAKDAALSQDAGLRHRREGLAYRLYLKARQRRWFPAKRVAPNNNVSRFYKVIFRLRIIIAAMSSPLFFFAKKMRSWPVFLIGMKLIVVIYNRVYSLRRA